LAGRTPRHIRFTATTGAPTQISKNADITISKDRWKHFMAEVILHPGVKYTNENAYRD